jgi:hypothetical protein
MWLDVAPIVALALVGAFLTRAMFRVPQARSAAALGIGAVTLTLFVFAGADSSWVRAKIRRRYAELV